MNDTMYRFTDYNKAIYRYIPYTTYRLVGCKIRVAYGGKMNGVMRGRLALRQRASPSALPRLPTPPVRDERVCDGFVLSKATIVITL